MLALLGLGIIPIFFTLFFGFLGAPLFRARRGDPTMLYVALVVAAVGVVLLFMARLPLYRERRFFTFGPGALDQRHRRLYRWAYGFIAAGVVLMVLLHLVMR
jgi:hypothetical protein